MIHRVRLRRTLRVMSADGAAASVMVGAGETYLPAFVLALGMSPLSAGLVATVPMVAGGLLGLLAPLGIARAGGYRAWVVVCAVVQAASFVPLVVAALSDALPGVTVFACAAAYWAAGMAATPAWNAWVGRLVPMRVRGRYFGGRQSLAQAGVLVGLVGAGVGLELGSAALGVAFAWVFGTAGAARLVSAAFLLAHPNTPTQAPLGPRATLGTARRSEHWSWMVLVAATYGAVNLAGPFVTPLFLAQARASYLEYTVLISALFVAKIVALPQLGRYAAGGSARRMMAVGAAGITVVPLLLVASTSMPYLFAVQLLSGVSWAAFELAAQLGFLSVAAESERAALQYAFNALHAAVAAIGTVAGGALLVGLGAGRSAYVTLFALSCAARAIVVVLLAKRLRGETLPDQTPPVRVIAARPWGGAILRPILAAMPPLRRARRPTKHP